MNLSNYWKGLATAVFTAAAALAAYFGYNVDAVAAIVAPVLITAGVIFAPANK